MPQCYAYHYNKTTSNSSDHGVAIKDLKKKEFNIKCLGVNKSEAIHHDIHHPKTGDRLYIPSKK